ncbi:hypothetical protein PT277_07560 [Acetobacteraceae bacterium ESL0709]|nr:hypothetical protein [Acetobacteraceae bacterium ESL0697]MDF7678534.1 hypothetical protein [Acetobacteraceae bacterium ESL0709]
MTKAQKVNPARKAPSKMRNERNEAAMSLLQHISGEETDNFVQRFLQDPAQIDRIISEISEASPLERLRKLRRTSNIMVSGRIEADYAYVGLPPEAEECCFEKGFKEFLYPRLGKRAESFALLFEQLKLQENPLIIETGCLRVPNNWEGDGQSTFQYDWFARAHRGHVITIDINQDSIESTRRACSGATSAILNDSVETLHMLSENLSRPASLLYLDSFDLDLSNPMPSAIHHAMELMAARNLVGPGTLICVDDFNVPPLGAGGKGLIVDKFMHSIRAEVVYSGYQRIWKIK